MYKHKSILLTLLAVASITAASHAQSTNTTTNSTGGRGTIRVTNTAPRVTVKQGDLASKTASFGKIAKTTDAYKTALDAHALDGALKQVDKEGAFKGKVTAIFEPRGGAMAIMNFDANYRTALTALLKKDEFAKFPALTNLISKEVVVSGKFINYQGRAEIVLTNAAQIKVVE